MQAVVQQIGSAMSQQCVALHLAKADASAQLAPLDRLPRQRVDRPRAAHLRPQHTRFSVCWLLAEPRLGEYGMGFWTIHAGNSSLVARHCSALIAADVRMADAHCLSRQGWHSAVLFLSHVSGASGLLHQGEQQPDACWASLWAAFSHVHGLGGEARPVTPA